MNIATVYAWFARESVRAAEKTDDVRQRQMWMKLAEQWAAAAQQHQLPLSRCSSLPSASRTG